MLSQSPLNLSPTPEDPIISSFYEQRKSRLSSKKYHNLLKKNISFFHPQGNCFEITKNELTQRTEAPSQPFSSTNISHPQSYSNSSCKKANSSEKRPQKGHHKNSLSHQQLSSLNQHSHSLHVPQDNPKVPLKLNYNYSQNDTAHYLVKISALQKQLEQLKERQKKQQKLIESISKMRKTMLNVQEDCSLKQLWRWIKQLPKHP